MNISNTVVDREILEAGLEDVIGIYEVIWRLNTVFPSASIAAKYDAADRRVRELLQGGHIRLVKHFRGQPDRIEAVHAADIDAVLRSPTAWYPCDLTSGASQVAYETTDLGAPLYERLHEKSKTAT